MSNTGPPAPPSTHDADRSDAADDLAREVALHLVLRRSRSRRTPTPIAPAVERRLRRRLTRGS